MVSLETFQAMPKSGDLNSSPRISFSGEIAEERNFISISPKSPNQPERLRAGEFEFLSGNATSEPMHSADELFFEGKLLPFWQVQNSEKLEKVSLKEKEKVEVEKKEVYQHKEEAATRVTTWFIDEDPSPRPPKCTVLWKELMRLRKQRPSSLSPSSSSSSSSSSSFGGDLPPIAEGKEGSGNREKHAKRLKKGGLERTRSTSIRIRPMVNVPICTQGKNNSQLPPLFSMKKTRSLDR